MHDERFPNATILVVDDEGLIRWSVAATLAESGAAVCEAADAASALAHFSGTRRHPIDAVVLDVRLPDGDGLQVLSEIKRRQPGCPIILMTAYGTPEITEQAARAGAYRLVAKPFSMDEMRRLVHGAIEGVP